ncbi:putative zinc finger BED domain-containing protein 1-like [Ditylenchus destructor]|uniref:Zinc finger BED domain-containing protein 1-like n=1 Tax=Ditylenchus destructor TaxID=166010 RepID=A0AAD4NCC0_9BILA|nr:putative zinc finger BED domain-containing protein 1-like [Ditylenchus destructor]
MTILDSAVSALAGWFRLKIFELKPVPSQSACDPISALWKEIVDYDTNPRQPLQVSDPSDSKKNKASNPMDWWKDNAFHYPLLCKFAKRYLSAVCTTRMSEGLFSTARNVFTYQRMRLKPLAQPAQELYLPPVSKPVGPNASGAGLSAGFMLSVLRWMFPKYTNKDLAYANSLPNSMLTQNKDPIHHLRRECHLCLAELAHSTTADNC